MAEFIAVDARRGDRVWLGSPGREVWRTWLLDPPAGTREPQAFLIEYGPGVVLQTHFHDVDEFQVVVAGSGSMGSHAIAPYTVHHAHAWTPYGPIVAGPEGLSFLTLRALRDSAGPRKLPEQRPALDAVADRRPWQGSERVTLHPQPVSLSLCTPLGKLVDAGASAGDVLQLAPDETRDVGAGAGGAFIALLAGSFREGNATREGLAVAFLQAAGGSVSLRAGPQGAAALVLRFRAHG